MIDDDDDDDDDDDNNNNNNNNNNNEAIIITRGLEIRGWLPAGNSHVLWVGEALFSLGWQSPRDGVSIKILVVVQPKNH